MPQPARDSTLQLPSAWLAPVRHHAAEAFGTFFLTLVAAGSEVAAAHTGAVSPAAKVVAPALVVLSLIYALGDCSGAHFNPVVTLAFALRQDFPWRRVPTYWLVQMTAALLAAAVLRALFGTEAHVGASLPHIDPVPALWLETLATWLLVTVILGTATRHRLVGPQAALAVGATISLDGLCFGPLSGASMNPARSLGSAVVAGEVGDVWLYVVGPLLGALLAVALMALIKPRRDEGEREAAVGEDEGQHSPFTNDAEPVESSLSGSSPPSLVQSAKNRLK
jgi:aquaporin Z